MPDIPLSTVVVILGLIPLYVGALMVEKHYVSFWPAFWNLYGVVVVCVGLLFQSESANQLALTIGAIIVVSIILYAALRWKISHIVRSLGASRIITSITVGIVALFFTMNILISLAVVVLHYVFLGLVKGAVEHPTH